MVGALHASMVWLMSVGAAVGYPVQILGLLPKASGEGGLQTFGKAVPSSMSSGGGGSKWYTYRLQALTSDTDRQLTETSSGNSFQAARCTLDLSSSCSHAFSSSVCTANSNSYYGHCGVFQVINEDYACKIPSSCDSFHRSSDNMLCCGTDTSQCCKADAGAVAGLSIGVVVLLLLCTLGCCCCCTCCPLYGRCCGWSKPSSVTVLQVPVQQLGGPHALQGQALPQSYATASQQAPQPKAPYVQPGQVVYGQPQA